nr:MAG TPA: hypothetical protein [Bacteriophage sp.]
MPWSLTTRPYVVILLPSVLEIANCSAPALTTT